MKILALIDNPQITIKLKTAIILIVALTCFLASLVLFLLSWFHVRKQRLVGQDSVNRATSTNLDEPVTVDATRTDASTPVVTVKGAGGPEASNGRDEIDTGPKASKQEGIVVDMAFLKSKLEEMNERLSQTLTSVSELSSQVNAMSATINDEQTFRRQREERKTLADEKRRQFEEERARTEDLEQRRAALRTKMQKRLEELEQTEILQIAVVTKELLDELMRDSSERIELGKDFSDYQQAAAEAQEVRTRVEGSHPAGGPQSVDSQSELKTDFDAFERLIEELDRNHRAMWFTGLLEEAGRYSSLQDKANELKRLLKVEEVTVEPGSAPRDLNDLEVVSAEGRGKRAIISEVVESGYRLTETGTVLKRPKVRVHFEV